MVEQAFMKTPETVILHPKEYRTSGKNEVNSRLSMLTNKLAKFIGAYEHTEPFSIRTPLPGHWQWVPVFTLVQPEAAQLGIKTEEDLYGGVVSHEYMSNKAIAHGLVKQKAIHPLGWRQRFTEETEDLVLPG